VPRKAGEDYVLVGEAYEDGVMKGNSSSEVTWHLMTLCCVEETPLDMIFNSIRMVLGPCRVTSTCGNFTNAASALKEDIAHLIKVQSNLADLDVFIPDGQERIHIPL